ncbi:uncharacterized protein [Saccopteryx leptura]|uniref:uncharacterized protein n=1 Tax=Saccopteryx leptura TaxID=249018 RepID=UPI00339BC31B
MAASVPDLTLVPSLLKPSRLESGAEMGLLSKAGLPHGDVSEAVKLVPAPRLTALWAAERGASQSGLLKWIAMVVSEFAAGDNRAEDFPVEYPPAPLTHPLGPGWGLPSKVACRVKCAAHARLQEAMQPEVTPHMGLKQQEKAQVEEEDMPSAFHGCNSSSKCRDTAWPSATFNLGHGSQHSRAASHDPGPGDTGRTWPCQGPLRSGQLRKLVTFPRAEAKQGPEVPAQGDRCGRELTVQECGLHSPCGCAMWSPGALLLSSLPSAGYRCHGQGRFRNITPTHVTRLWPEGIVEIAVSQELGAHQQLDHSGSSFSGPPSLNCAVLTFLKLVASVPSLEPPRPRVLRKLLQIEVGKRGGAYRLGTQAGLTSWAAPEPLGAFPAIQEPHLPGGSPVSSCPMPPSPSGECSSGVAFLWNSALVPPAASSLPCPLQAPRQRKLLPRAQAMRVPSSL